MLTRSGVAERRHGTRRRHGATLRSAQMRPSGQQSAHPAASIREYPPRRRGRRIASSRSWPFTCRPIHDASLVELAACVRRRIPPRHCVLRDRLVSYRLVRSGPTSRRVQNVYLTRARTSMGRGPQDVRSPGAGGRGVPAKSSREERRRKCRRCLPTRARPNGERERERAWQEASRIESSAPRGRRHHATPATPTGTLGLLAPAPRSQQILGAFGPCTGQGHLALSENLDFTPSRPAARSGPRTLARC